jgi:hypothetical protein
MFWAAALCLAQLDTASIVGTVLDSSGAVIPGAKVQVQNMGTAATVDLTTDQNGNFIAPVLPIGKYKVTVSVTGFNTFVQEGILLSVADRIKLTIELKPGAVTQQVTVVGETPVVETGSTTLGGVVTTTQLSVLPLNGRALTQLLSTVPGALMLGTSTQRSINGASMNRLFSSGARFLLDGTDSGQIDSDLPDGGYGTGARMTRASVESVAEVRMLASSFSAEYGQSGGGVINYITKSGTNEFHGTLFEYFRNEKLDARGFFNRPPDVKPAFRLNQYGGSLGGPLKRDKAFFFVNYEGVRQRQGLILNGFVPTAEFRATLDPVLRPVVDLLPLPNGPVSPADSRIAQYTKGVSNRLREDTLAIKTDFNLSSKDRFSARYNLNDSFTLGYFGLARGQQLAIPYRSQLGKLTYSRTLSPSVLNEAGFGVNRLYTYRPSASEEDVRKFPITVFGGGVAAAGPGVFDVVVHNTAFTFLDTLSWVKGRHQVKFGTQIVRNRANKAVFFQSYVLFLGLLNAPGFFLSNQPFLQLTIGVPGMGQRNTLNNFFVQDDFQATKNLTFNLGLRYQYDTAPTEQHGRNRNFDFVKGQLDPAGIPMFNAPKRNFGPRVGFAWTPFSSRKLVVRGGYGIFHVPINPAVTQNTPANDPNIGQQRQVTMFDYPGMTAFPNPSNIQSRPASSLIYAFARDFDPIYTQAWNLNIQQGFGESMVLQAAYIGNRGLHYIMLDNMDPNRINPVTHVRPYAAFGPMGLFATAGDSRYDSLQVSLKRRFSRGLALNINYTWSHNLDLGGVSSGSVTQDYLNLRAEWANSDYDVRHVLEFDYTYELPAAPRIPKWLGSGWQINGLTVMRSGVSVNVVTSRDMAGIGSTTGQRPNLVPGVSVRPSNYSIPGNQINFAAFSMPAAGTFGNAGRNLLKGPAVYNWDFSLFKNFRVKEGQTLQFRAEMFNIFNTPQFHIPSADISSPATFGQSFYILPAAGGFWSNRQIQFALRYNF